MHLRRVWYEMPLSRAGAPASRGSYQEGWWEERRGRKKDTLTCLPRGRQLEMDGSGNQEAPACLDECTGTASGQRRW